jgi:hypothetical protein
LTDPTRQSWRFPGTDPACGAAWLALVVWCSPAFPQSAANPAEEKSSMQGRAMSYGVEIALSSGHADRGFIISDRPVLQPVAWVTTGLGEFSVWSNFTLAATTEGSRPQIWEMEVTRERRWKHLTIAPAVTMFFYHDLLSTDRDRSIQGWLYLSYHVGPFSLFTNHSVDLLTYRGAYYGEAGIESERHVSPSVELGALVGVGWASTAFNAGYAGVPKSALNRIRAEASLKAHVAPRFYLGPELSFSTLVDRAVRGGPDVVRPTYVLFKLITGGEF